MGTRLGVGVVEAERQAARLGWIACLDNHDLITYLAVAGGGILVAMEALALLDVVFEKWKVEGSSKIVQYISIGRGGRDSQHP